MNSGFTERILDSLLAHYQPILDLGTGEIIGCEALARYRAEDGSVVSLGPVIEQIEQEPANLRVLLHRLLACVSRDAIPLFNRYPHFYVSVNVPPVALGGGHGRRVLEELGLDRYLRNLVIEITERQALGDVGREALAIARELGMRVSVDDFGTGHSGLLQLVGLRCDTLKLDRSLIESLVTDPTTQRLLRGIVALAAALRVNLVAEGVETPDQAMFLRAAGVDYGQGWLWSKAVPAEQLELLLQKP